jgi:hypothetical protein
LCAVPVAAVPAEDFPVAAVPLEDVPAAAVAAGDVPVAAVPAGDVPVAAVPDEDVDGPPGAGSAGFLVHAIINAITVIKRLHSNSVRRIEASTVGSFLTERPPDSNMGDWVME